MSVNCRERERERVIRGGWKFSKLSFLTVLLLRLVLKLCHGCLSERQKLRDEETYKGSAYKKTVVAISHARQNIRTFRQSHTLRERGA